MVQIIYNETLYSEVVEKTILPARSCLWIATADIKDMHIITGRHALPLLKILADKAEDGVALRLIHAGEPGKNFRKTFDRYPVLIDSLEMMHCPRNHSKTVMADFKRIYTGSANITGAGIGAKSPDRRNFETGLISDEDTLITSLTAEFDRLWMGSYCSSCGRKQYCTQYDEMIQDV
ncbi:MAG: phospholipase D-like domain-containing protein [Fibrobacterota bacterium]